MKIQKKEQPKLSLEELKVQSFVTSLDDKKQQVLKGGADWDGEGGGGGGSCSWSGCGPTSNKPASWSC